MYTYSMAHKAVISTGYGSNRMSCSICIYRAVTSCCTTSPSSWRTFMCPCGSPTTCTLYARCFCLHSRSATVFKPCRNAIVSPMEQRLRQMNYGECSKWCICDLLATLCVARRAVHRCLQCMRLRLWLRCGRRTCIQLSSSLSALTPPRNSATSALGAHATMCSENLTSSITKMRSCRPMPPHPLNPFDRRSGEWTK